MDYSEIDTTEQLLNAFKQCQNAGEEIQLFESLAERENPPVDAFVEILRKIKLETVLALAIQAFGKITNDDVKAKLTGSEDLLAMLCEQAKSGATDLIRWSAATTIENLGFSFIDVSQYLTEEPEVIIQRILQSKVRALTDGRNNDYESILRFWIYGSTYELRAVTVNRVGGNLESAVNAVVKAQDVWGVHNINLLLIELLQDHKPDFFNFIFAGQNTSENILRKSTSDLLKSSEFRVLISNQIFCVGSYHSTTRKCAVDFLCSYNHPSIQPDEPDIEKAINIIRDVTSRIEKVAISEVKLNKSDIDQDDIEIIYKTISDDFKSARTAIESKKENDLRQYNSNLVHKDAAKRDLLREIDSIPYSREKRDLATKIENMSNERVSAQFFWLIILSPVAVGIAFLVLYLPVGFFVAIVTLNKVSWPVLNGIVWLASIGCVAYPFAEAFNKNIKTETKKSRLQEDIRRLENLEENAKSRLNSEVSKNEEEKERIKEQIKNSQQLCSLEINKAEKVKKTRIAGVEKIENLLKDRKESYKMVEKSFN